jgi:ATP-dependent DNA helicase RecG
VEPPIDIAELLRGESAWVEWKKTGDPLKIVAKLVAFANDSTSSGRGGWVVCGVEEAKTAQGVVTPCLTGLAQGDLTGVRNRVMEGCARHVSPPLVPQVYEAAIAGDPSRRLLLFYMPVSGQLHEHQTRDGSKVWVLFDSETREATGELLRELRGRKGALPPFLQRPCFQASLQDLYLTAAEEFRREAGLPRPIEEYLEPGERIEASAPPLCVAHEIGPGRTRVVPTYLAVLLFGREPTSFLQGAHAILSVYPGTARTEVHSQRFKLHGPLVKLIHDVIDKLAGYMGVSIDKSRSAMEIRQNRQRFSEKAVQEAVVNAFAHRDYENPEPVRITVFSDRIEVASPGAVPSGVDVDRLKAGGAVGARWRNPALSSFLERMAIGVQAEGQGVPTIHRETLEVAERPPEYLVDAMQVTAVLPAYQPPPPSPRPSPPRSGPLTEAREGLVLISIGANSIRPSVDASRAPLALEGIDVVMDLALPGHMDTSPEGWQQVIKRLRAEFTRLLDDPSLSRLHLFYRGPIAILPLLGALIVNAKPLRVYHHHDGGSYSLAYDLDRRFLKSTD